MKNKIIFSVVICYLFFFSNNFALSQNNSDCLTSILLENFPHDTIPEYLKEGWNQPKTVPVAVAYFHFPDSGIHGV